MTINIFGYLARIIIVIHITINTHLLCTTFAYSAHLMKMIGLHHYFLPDLLAVLGNCLLSNFCLPCRLPFLEYPHKSMQTVALGLERIGRSTLSFW